MEQYEEKTPYIPHYYGNTIRLLFLGSALILLLSAMVDKELFAFYLFIGIFVVLGIVILAGLTSPNTRFSIISDTGISAVLFIFFEYSALMTSPAVNGGAFDAVFLLRQLLALIFLLALYFSVKTWRGMSIEKPKDDTRQL